MFLVTVVVDSETPSIDGMSLKGSLLLKSRSSNWIGSVSASWDVTVLINWKGVRLLEK